MSDEQIPELTDEELDFLNSCFDLARTGDAQLLQLVDAGLPANLTDHKGDTLLALAAYNGRDELVAGLLQRGADPNRMNERGQTALGCALFAKSAASVSALVAAGADPTRGAMNAWSIVDFFHLDEMRALLPAPEVQL